MCSSPSSLMSSRVSTTCMGSMPMVGSSNMSTSGSCNMACAMPVRCRYPLDSFPTSALR